MSVQAEQQTTTPLPIEGVLIGPKSPVFLSPNVLNELAQVRQTYDPAGIEELARSMVYGSLPDDSELMELSDADLSERLVLLNPLVVGRFSSLERAQKYLNNHAVHYQFDIPRAAESLERAEDGSYYLLIAGHRRRRATHLLQQRFGISDERLGIAAHVFDDIEFDEALGLQLRENVYEQPPAHEEARSIERYYRHACQKEGRILTIRELCDRLGMKETKVGNALAFASLPAEIQALTPNNLPYTIVRQLKPLYDAYRDYHRRQTYDGRISAEESDADTYALRSIQIVANKLIESRLKGRTKDIDRVIRGYINDVEAMSAYQTDELFAVPEASLTRRVRTSYLRLGREAARVIQYLEGAGQLAPEARAALVEALGLGAMTGVATEATEDTPDLFAI